MLIQNIKGWRNYFFLSGDDTIGFIDARTFEVHQTEQPMFEKSMLNSLNDFNIVQYDSETQMLTSLMMEMN